MKLLYITNGITGSGGLERVLSVKASGLAEDFGYEVHILSLNETDKEPFYKFSSQIHFHSIQVDGNPIAYLNKYISGIRRKVNEIQPDVISVCDDGLKGFFIPKLIDKKIPAIYERHVSKNISLGNLEKAGLKKKILGIHTKMMDLLSNNFNAFVVLTHGNKNEWPKTQNLEVIPNPLSFYPKNVSSLESKKVIAVGKQSYQKSYDRLLKAWQLAVAENPGWELHIYGKKEPTEKLPELASALSVDNSVFFHNPKKNIEERYLESSIFVLSSRYEGFGMVIIEAMACGLPAVSFDCPYGPADIISDGKDGFLIENGDVEKFAARLSELMRNTGLRNEMGLKAKVNVKVYNAENILKKWDTLFKNLLK